MNLYRLAWGCVFTLLFANVSVSVAREKLLTPALAKINDARAWSVINGDTATATEAGASVVRLSPKGGDRPGSNVALALVEGVELAEGTLEIDLNGGGSESASFLGLAFGAAGEQRFEAVYFRPFNFLRDGEKDGQAFRAHAVQYIAWPDHPWEKLRKQSPGVYEARVAPIPDPSGWFHARIEVTSDKVRVWVDGGKTPCLVVDRLGGGGKGKVGLWVDSKEGSFRNLRIRAGK
jgi:hypothetical protein